MKGKEGSGMYKEGVGEGAHVPLWCTVGRSSPSYVYYRKTKGNHCSV